MDQDKTRKFFLIIGVLLFIFLGLEVFFDVWTNLTISIVGISPHGEVSDEVVQELFSDPESVEFIISGFVSGMFYFIFFFAIYRSIKSKVRQKQK